MLTITELKNYYKSEMDTRNLVLDIHEDIGSIRKKVSDFTRMKGSCYLNFVDESKSKEDVVLWFELVELGTLSKTMDDEYRFFDVYSDEQRNTFLKVPFDVVIDGIANAIQEIENEIER